MKNYQMEKMTSGQWQGKIRTRQSLLMYLIQRLRLDSYHLNPQAQQIILTEQSRIDIEKLLKI
jgi:hypothetical protein